jgi:polyisoprenoid-binding protein YceI
MNPTEAPAGTKTYTIDPAHTAVRFSVRHLMISRVHGQFSGVSGTVDVPTGSNVPSAVNVAIEVASIDTREPQRDGHLKSPDFFHAENFPQITFHSTRIEGSEEEFSVAGDLTIHGETKPVVLSATFDGAGPDPWGNQRLGYEAHAKIKRSDFGLTWNQALEAGGFAIGDEIKIDLNLEVVAPK